MYICHYSYIYNTATSLSQDDGSPVSVFSLSGSNAQDGHLAAARNGVKRLRTVCYFPILDFQIIYLFWFGFVFCGLCCIDCAVVLLFFQVRHPNILSFLHSTEIETYDAGSPKVTIYIVTEPVMPLSEKIKELGLEGTQRYQLHYW